MTRRPLAARLLSLLALVLVGSVAGSPPATAHEVDPSVRTVIDEVAPAVDGLRIAVGTSVTTQLLAANDTDEVLEVLADTGEPFLRIGPDGVEANLASPSWYLTNQPFGAEAPPAGVTADAPPRWARVSTESTWGWFDHRLHPGDVTGSLGETTRPTFEIPMRLGDTDLVVRGHLEQRITTLAFAARLQAVPDPTTGLVVQLLEGRAPGLFVRYDGEGEVVVTGSEGEPFLRLGPAGAEVNRHSPTWVFTAQAQGMDLGGIEEDPHAPPDWSVVGGGPSYAWLDPRALIETVGDDDVEQRWIVPLAIAGVEAEIVGVSTASIVPLAAAAGLTAEDDGRPWLVAGLVTGALLTVAAVTWLALRGRG